MLSADAKRAAVPRYCIDTRQMGHKIHVHGSNAIIAAVWNFSAHKVHFAVQVKNVQCPGTRVDCALRWNVSTWHVQPHRREAV